MRNMNCRNVRHEIEEAAVGDLLSSDVNDHLSNCVACKTFFREQTSLQELVASLGTVEAPGDFDFRLRARLAGEKAKVEDDGRDRLLLGRGWGGNRDSSPAARSTPIPAGAATG